MNILNYDMDIETVADLQILILRICIKTDDLDNLKHYLNFYNMREDIYGNYLIRYASRYKAVKTIKYLATIKIVQEFMNMTEKELLDKFLNR